MEQMSTDKARQILGVDKGATKAEIRKAWMGQVMRYHPDRAGGCANKLMLANLANEVLTAETAEAVDETDEAQMSASNWWQRNRNTAEPTCEKPKQSGPKPSAKPGPQEAAPNGRKGGLRSQRGAAPVPNEERNYCQSKLASTRKQRAFAAAMRQNSGFYVDPGAVRPEQAIGGEHVASKVEMEDRWILFVVEAPMEAGQNTVALPTGNADAKSTVISFQSKQSGGGRVPISDVARQTYFPWADKVEIAFRSV